MRTIALTGGIGTGKSTVAGLLRARGVTVIDADEAVRAVQAPGTPGLARLVEAFGPDILDPAGALDRGRLAGVAFADADARRRLEEIVHPLVRDWMEARQREAEARGELVVVHDIPLLFESRLPAGVAPPDGGEPPGFEERARIARAAGFDAVLLVYAPEELQVRRLVEQRGMDPADVRARMAAQLPIERKRQLATHVIENTGTLDELTDRFEEVWGALR
ncbi:MAG: dephospho-CoA kinase [Candidatus Dormibacteraeota bacterium]|nr:dephospho-CoA kinase [Candidatus Dormibacteraeota bacterium]MBO0759720.1 dephospho-CoA kinase [Candidatus Dormibacteraeota bacterium]